MGDRIDHFRQVARGCAAVASAAVLAAGCATRPAAAPAPVPAAKPPPNIVFIFSDDHAWQAIGAYGGRLAALNPTPNLDRLATEGMLFENAFVTNAICAPSRAVALTGKHSHLNGVPTNVERFDTTQTTFPKLLRRAGYQTALVGKWHLKSRPPGFDHWAILPDQGVYYNPDFITPTGTVRDTGYVTERTTDRALEWLERQRDRSRPFALMYWHKAPHRPWEPAPAHLRKYEGTRIPEPPTLFDDYAGRASGAARTEMTIARDLHLNYDLKLWDVADTSRNRYFQDYPRELLARMTPEQRASWEATYGPVNERFRAAPPTGEALTRWKYERYLQDYLRSIASLDENIGRLLDYLERSGLAENTVIVYSSDQGFFLGEHGWYDKRWMYDESLRTPLIVRWPGVVRPGSRNRDLVQNLDFAPSFLEMAGAPVPAEMQGRSLVPLLAGRTPGDWRDAVYYHYYENPGEHNVPRHYGVRTRRHKLIHYYQTGEWELFDLEKDPDELRSVYADPRYAEVREQLKRRLAELQDQYRVPAAHRVAPVATRR